MGERDRDPLRAVVAARPGTPAVAVSALSYSYHAGHEILREISLSIAPGEAVVVAGPSGCGKTTLCHCLTGLAPSVLGGTLVGAVRVMGEDIVSIPVPEVSTRVGLVFQDPDNQMVTTTVEDELAFAPENLALSPPDIRRRVERELERFGIEHLALRSPVSLSGGEKRLVAIASVLTLDPPVLILDEPFTHLDEHGRKMVRDAVLELKRQGRTMIIVEHDLALADFADRYLVIEGGRLVADRTTPPAAYIESVPALRGAAR